VSGQELLHDLFVEHYTAMERLAFRLCSSRELAQDVVQETFLVAQTKLDVLAAHPDPRGWLYRTLRNVIGDMYRRQKRLSALQDAVRHTQEPAARDEPSVELLYGGAIPDDELELLRRFYCDGEPCAALAAELHITPEACRKRIQRAKRRLRAAIGDG